MGGINIYNSRKNWKIILFVFATIICIVSLSITNKLVSDLDKEERKKIELWAEATNQLVNSGMGPNNNILASRIMQENTTIPIILTNEVGEIIGNRNLPQRPKQEAFLKYMSGRFNYLNFDYKNSMKDLFFTLRNGSFSLRVRSIFMIIMTQFNKGKE